MAIETDATALRAPSTALLPMSAMARSRVSPIASAPMRYAPAMDRVA
jgi:hypothetical protein